MKTEEHNAHCRGDIPIKSDSMYMEEEIDIREIFIYIKSNINKVYISIGLFFLLGILIVILSPIEYTASTTLLPENNDSGNRATRGLLQNFGLGNVFTGGSGSEDLNPSLYPKIVSSTPFLIKMIDEEIYFTELDSTISIYNYFRNVKPSKLDILKSWTFGLPNKIINWFSGPNKHSNLPVNVQDVQENDSTKSNNRSKIKQDDSENNQKKSQDEKQLERIKNITRAELSVVGKLGRQIKVTLEDPFVEVRVNMHDPLASAAIADKVVEYLKEYVIDYKVGKLKKNLEFVIKRFEEVEKKYVLAQNRLSNFRDRNININTANARSEEQRLEAEYELAFNMYRSLAQQVEQARIQLQEETPVFNVLEPVKVPISKSSPNIPKIILIWIFLGVFAGFIWIAFQFVIDFVKRTF